MKNYFSTSLDYIKVGSNPRLSCLCPSDCNPHLFRLRPSDRPSVLSFSLALVKHTQEGESRPN